MIQELGKEAYDAMRSATVVRLRALREDTALWLAVDATDKAVGGDRLRSYIEGCISTPELHNLYELLAVPLFAERISRYYYFHQMAARKIGRAHV